MKTQQQIEDKIAKNGCALFELKKEKHRLERQLEILEINTNHIEQENNILTWILKEKYDL